MSDISPTPVETTIIFPVPMDAPDCDLRKNPDFSAVHSYYDGNGELHFQVFRLEAPDPEDATKTVKSFVLAIFAAFPDGSRKWQYKAPPAPRPIYGRAALETMSTSLVLVVEGEKCADAAQRAFPEVPVVTWSGGSNAVGKPDFSLLKGRNVIIMPDHDELGAKAAAALEKVLLEVGAASIRIVDIEKLLTDEVGHALKGGDIVDLLAAGAQFDGIDAFLLVPASELLAMQEVTASDPSIDAFLLEKYGYELDLPDILKLTKNGLTKDVENNRGEIVAIFVASPIAIIGRSFTAADGAGWGKVAAYLTPRGTWDTIVIPDYMTAKTVGKCANFWRAMVWCVGSLSKSVRL